MTEGNGPGTQFGGLMKTLSRRTLGWLLVVGVAAFPGCLQCGPPPECFEKPTTVPWNGKLLDGGFLDGGIMSQEGYYEVCIPLCPGRSNTGGVWLDCTVPEPGLLKCGVRCGS